MHNEITMARNAVLEEVAVMLDQKSARDKALAQAEHGVVGFGVTAGFAAAYFQAAKDVRAMKR